MLTSLLVWVLGTFGVLYSVPVPHTHLLAEVGVLGPEHRGAWHSSPVASEKQPLERLASRVNTGQACRPQLWIPSAGT